MTKLTPAVLLITLSCLAAGAPAAARPRRDPLPAGEVFFDDFSYANRDALVERGWIVRTVAGWPGVPGATWRAENVTIRTDSSDHGNRILRMTSSTDGTSENTTQTQICQQRKYLEGTYAARVRFTDTPSSGSGGDQLVESFYTISPLVAPMDPDYSELDWEYLPNGGWGVAGSSLYSTTWETYHPEPEWKKENVFQLQSGSRAGWHILVTQVADGRVRYYLDGKLVADHGDEYYPESMMSINFNLWFVRDGAAKVEGARTYTEDVDWVFHAAHQTLSPEEVEDTVNRMRRKGVRFRDTVQAPVPALPSPCDS